MFNNKNYLGCVKLYKKSLKIKIQTLWCRWERLNAQWLNYQTKLNYMLLSYWSTVYEKILTLKRRPVTPRSKLSSVAKSYISWLTLKAVPDNIYNILYYKPDYSLVFIKWSSWRQHSSKSSKNLFPQKTSEENKWSAACLPKEHFLDCKTPGLSLLNLTCSVQEAAVVRGKLAENMPLYCGILILIDASFLAKIPVGVSSL